MRVGGSWTTVWNGKCWMKSCLPCTCKLLWSSSMVCWEDMVKVALLLYQKHWPNMEPEISMQSGMHPVAFVCERNHWRMHREVRMKEEILESSSESWEWGKVDCFDELTIGRFLKTATTCFKSDQWLLRRTMFLNLAITRTEGNVCPKVKCLIYI